VNATAARALFESAVSPLDERLLAARGWVIHAREYPLLDISFLGGARQELRLRLNCSDWNDTPPSVDLVSPEGDTLKSLPTLRQGSSFFNAGPHPKTGRPFVCTPGVREYHEHPSHLNDVWSNYQSMDAFSIGGILMQLWRGWEKLWP
jgi:hypothetical protein